MFSKTIFAAVAVFSALADAHMIMTNPVPYANTTLNNSPLDASGSDFPCKIRANMWDNQEALLGLNVFQIGKPNTLSFEGTATHGGGSCQVSLTTDLEPTKDSTWMVIHSIEGGCPANVPGNLDVGGPTTPDPTTFQFTIPDGIAPGKYALAWTWFNRIGNREMYMNCAPITVVSGSSKRDETSITKRDSFPPMFVANINGCMTTEGVDIRFPDPGDSVDYAGNPSNLMPLGEAACTGGSGSSTVYATSGATSTAVSSATSSAAASATTESSTPTSVGVTISVAETTATGAPGVFANGASPVASSPATSSVSEAGPSSTSLSSSSSSSGALSGSCSPEGTWNCVGGSSFQRCASGTWSTPIDMASGTVCTAGQSESLNVAAVKRSPRVPDRLHFRRHINRASHI